MENGEGNLQNMTGSYNIEFETNPDVEAGEMDIQEIKPKVEKKGKKKKKGNDSDSDEEVIDNKLEDNPVQVICSHNTARYFC